ncbi:MAG: hypothetical protein U9R08_02790 [Nanoarchaeota archaeon]|nr:hypothetical protein [Nanoarchaeota archaeon]
MKIKEKNGLLEITTTVYQAKNGALYINWGNRTIQLTKDEADIVCYNLKDFNVDDFKKFYY